MLCSDKHSARFYKLCSNVRCGLRGRIKLLECGVDRPHICACAGGIRTDVEPMRGDQAVPKAHVTASSPCSPRCRVLRCRSLCSRVPPPQSNSVPVRSHQTSKYPLGRQSPVSLWLFLGCKDQSLSHSSCTSWFLTAPRQHSETDIPDSAVPMPTGRLRPCICYLTDWQIAHRFIAEVLSCPLFCSVGNSIPLVKPDFNHGHWLKSLAPVWPADVGASCCRSLPRAMLVSCSSSTAPPLSYG